MPLGLIQTMDASDMPQARNERMKSRPITSFIESRVCLATLVIYVIDTDKTGISRHGSHIFGFSANGV